MVKSPISLISQSKKRQEAITSEKLEASDKMNKKRALYDLEVRESNSRPKRMPEDPSDLFAKLMVENRVRDNLRQQKIQRSAYMKRQDYGDLIRENLSTLTPV